MTWKEVPLTRDRAIALLAIGAATADPELASELNLDGIPDANLVAFADAVRCLQSSDETDDAVKKSDAKTTVKSFLHSLLITRSPKVTVRKQLLDEANRWGLFSRGKKWMRKNFGQTLIPQGTRVNAIEKFKALGFME